MLVRFENECRRFAWLALMLSGALVGLLPLTAAAHQSVALSWNPSALTNVVGYKIYVGTTSQSYYTNLNAGSLTNINLGGLNSGTTYYVAASTYDASGTESALSSEISFQIPPDAAVLSELSKTDGEFSFAVAGVAGGQYVVEASSDLKNWTAVETNTAPFTFVDADVAAHPQRFYRTAYLGN